MRRLLAIVVWAFAPLALALAVSTAAVSQELDSFSVLAGSTITNTGPTTISGNVGLSPGLGPAITGFPPGLIGGTIYTGSDDSNTVAENAQIALTTLFNNLQAEPATQTLTGQTLGADVGEITPGVYFFASSAQLTGQLTLNAQGDPNAVFVIQIGSTLTTASASSVLLINGAQGKNVYWVVGSSATLGTGTTFVGQILALTSITLTTGVTINCGAALAQNGFVTLDTNTISTFCAFSQFGTVVGPTGTPNQQAIAAALDAYVTGGGTLPPAFQDLLNLSPSQMEAAFDQLSGEAATGVAPTGMQAMNSFTSLIFDTAFASGPGGPAPVQPKQPGTVKALGYGPEDAPATSAAFDAIERGTPGSARYDVWAAGYGGQYNTDGNDGAHDRFASAFGFATGFGVRVTPDTKVGLAIGAGGTNFSLPYGLGSGSSDMVQTAVYSRTDFDAAYVAAAVAYAWHGVTTDRYVNIAGTDHLTADYSAQNVAGKIEAGYSFGAITPYAAVGMQAFYTPAYSEHAASGSSVFALDYDAQTTTAARTELGARLAKTIPLPNGMTLQLHSRAAWAHDFWSGTQMTAHFQALPAGSSFTVEGAKPPSDLLLVGTGAQIALANGFSVATLFDGEFADGTQRYQGSLRLGYAW